MDALYFMLLVRESAVSRRSWLLNGPLSLTGQDDPDLREKWSQHKEEGLARCFEDEGTHQQKKLRVVEGQAYGWHFWLALWPCGVPAS